MHGGTLLLTSVVAILGAVARVDAGADPSDLPTAQLLSRANTLLSQGQGAEALALYDSVLERDPSDYATAYRKGVAALALGQTRAATESFERVLQLSEYDKARLQLSKIHLKQGDFDAGEQQISSYLKRQRGDNEGVAVQKQLKEGRVHLAAARKLRKAGRWEQCVGESTAGMQASPNSLEFRRLRSDCHIGGDNLEEANADLTRAAQLAPHSPEIALRLATISTLFLSYPASQALAPIRQCLHSDPESKPCKKAFRLLKALDKDLTKAQNFIEAGSYRSAVNVLDPHNKPGQGLISRVREAIAAAQKPGPDLGEAVLPASASLERQSQLLTKLLAHACKAHTHLNQHRLGRRTCAELVERDPENIDGLVGRGEALMADESWEEAVRVLSKAFENGGRSDRDVLARLQRAQKGLKVSKQKDYYKVLGVPRDVDDRTLKKAYRKATLRAHPDKGGSEEKMAALNEAYEVLSNPELRQRYDNGDDPNDPQQGHAFQQGDQVFQQFFQQGGMPFHGGGFPGGGGQTFSFRWG